MIKRTPPLISAGTPQEDCTEPPLWERGGGALEGGSLRDEGAGVWASDSHDAARPAGDTGLPHLRGGITVSYCDDVIKVLRIETGQRLA